MRFRLLLCIILTPVLLNSQIIFKKDAIYIFARSTEHKVNIIAEDFNLQDKQITHIGIGYFENDSIKIFNVSNFKTDEKGSALISESYASFVDLSDVTYSSIWKLKSDEKEIAKLKSILEEYSKDKIKFDDFFILDESNDYYCSEFIYRVLKKVNRNKFGFNPINKKLNAFYSNALHRKEFVYIPVDFFQSFTIFEKVYEKNL
jgi:hypothetical protein